MEEQQTFFQPKNHADKILSRLTDCFNAHTLTDVTLVAEGCTIPAHRLVLSACSDYFSAMFTNDLLEAEENEITLQGIDGNALSAIITYMYTGSLSMQAENIEDILTAACILQLSEVIDACSKFLVDHLHPSNCLGILQFADRQGCVDLFKVAHNYVMENFLDITKDTGSEFLQLSQEELMKLLASDDVNVPNEEMLFTAVIDWVSFDSASREEALPALLSLLKLPLMSPDFLADKVEPNPMVRKCPKCQCLLMEALKYHLLADRRHTLQSVRTKPRKSTVGVLLAVGGSETSSSDRMPSIEKYDLRTDRWQQIFTLNSRRLQFGVAVIGSRLFVVGGRDGLKTLNTVDFWDMHNKTWTQVSSMANHRHGLCVTTLEGPIYAIGGHDGWQYLNSVERWDVQSKKWSYVSPMNHARGTAAAVVLGTRIYVCGGRDGSSCLRSLESFDPHTNKWTLLTPMHRRRGGLGLSTLNGYLYAVGGHDCPAQSKQSSTSHGSRFSCCERYDPLTDQWTMVASLSGPKDAVGLCVLGDRLYCVGGYDGQKHLREVECYDPSKDTWTKVSPLTIGRAGACIAHVSYESFPMARSLSTLSLHTHSLGSPKVDTRTRMSMSYSEPRFPGETS
ncbi:kelch-like protein 5 [Watersipora subatra]|uniref:kelch-like protein 5 n=1 Tax=Watersipora subatra TaxID=2589382 RepID=UPI00355BE785